MGANIHIDLQNFYWRNSNNHYNDSNEAAAIDIFSMRRYSDTISYRHTCLPIFQGDGEKVLVGNAYPIRRCSHVFLLFLARDNRVREKG